MAEPTTIVVLSTTHLAVGDDVRPYQVVDLRDAAGDVSARYSRYLAADSSKWIRHGVWQSFDDGRVVSEGTYRHGLEHGTWKDLHANGQLAAFGRYEEGTEVGEWQFWNESGAREDSRELPSRR